MHRSQDQTKEAVDKSVKYILFSLLIFFFTLNGNITLISIAYLKTRKITKTKLKLRFKMAVNLGGHSILFIIF